MSQSGSKNNSVSKPIASTEKSVSPNNSSESSSSESSSYESTTGSSMGVVANARINHTLVLKGKYDDENNLYSRPWNRNYFPEDQVFHNGSIKRFQQCIKIQILSKRKCRVFAKTANRYGLLRLLLLRYHLETRVEAKGNAQSPFNQQKSPLACSSALKPAMTHMMLHQASEIHH